MVDFGGWEMPVSYGSQIEEHHAVRRDAGMFDVSHMLAVDLEMANPVDGDAGVRDFLRYSLANNIDKLTVPGKALYSCLLEPGGGVLDDLIVYFLREGRFRTVVNAGTADKDVAWLQSLIAARAAKITLTPRRDLAMIAVQGPRARERVWSVLPDSRAATETMKPFMAARVGEYFIARTGYTGEDGFEIMLPCLARGRVLGSPRRRRCHAVRPRLARYLASRSGNESLRAGHGRDGEPARVGACMDGRPRERPRFRRQGGAPRAASGPPTDGTPSRGQGRRTARAPKVTTGAGEGEITSGTFSPTLAASIALARAAGRRRAGQSAQVEVRGKSLAARVVKPPFVRNGKSLLN